MKPRDDRYARGLWWDRPWSLVDGCTPVSTGCAKCWARNWLKRFRGTQDIPVVFREDRLDLPRRVKRPTIWAVWNDMFHLAVTDQQIGLAFGTMVECPHHLFLVLTKRVERLANWSKRVSHYPGGDRGKHPVTGWPPNVMVGTSVENQKTADQRIPWLNKVKARRFLSVEPLIEPIYVGRAKVEWVIAGGETGAGARPCEPWWLFEISRWCENKRIPFWFKSYGQGGPKTMIAYQERREFPGTQR